MTARFDWLECELCGRVDDHVRPGLACYADDGRFDRINRCTDHQACRDRVEESGRQWPLADLTHSSR